LNLIRIMPAEGWDMQAEPRERSIDVIGGGIAGLWQALAFSQAGFRVTLHERAGSPLGEGASRWAGGMLAPGCEREGADAAIARLGRRSLDLWRQAFPETRFDGSLVVAHPRDRADFDRFARLAEGHERCDADGLAALEPALAGRFREALFFPGEGHVEPRRVLPALHARLAAAGVAIRLGDEADPAQCHGLVIDCRGLAARGDGGGELRAVKGETVLVEAPEVALTRPVRLIHPRWPLYVVPRPDSRFLIGATSIESDDEGVSLRSALELMSAAYALHPAFAEARILELGAGLRPAFPDNGPRVTVGNDRIAVNGLHRHGYLLAPALAELTVGHVMHGRIDEEVMRWS
jgi:glycine oxidase